MKNKNKILISVLLAVFVISLFAAGLTYSYLVDTETIDNIITIGKVSLEVKEDNYTDNPYLDAQQIISKDPYIENNGNKDEYVFMEVWVPVENVTLLYETDTVINETLHKEGTVRISDTDNELFRIKTNPHTNTPVEKGSDLPQKNWDVDFCFHKAADVSTAGWYQMNVPPEYAEKKVTINEKEKTLKYHKYLFAYNTKLSPKEKTVTLFDQIQLKSIIEEEFTGEYKIDVIGYGIQADLINTDGINNDTTVLTKEQCKSVYTIITNKRGDENT